MSNLLASTSTCVDLVQDPSSPFATQPFSRDANLDGRAQIDYETPSRSIKTIQNVILTAGNGNTIQITLKKNGVTVFDLTTTLVANVEVRILEFITFYIFIIR